MKKKLRLMMTMLLLAVMGSVWATEETINLSQQGYSNGQGVSSTQGTVVTLTYNQGGSSTPPAYYDTGTGVRVYAGGNMAVTADGNTITKVVVTYTKNNSPTISFSSPGINTSSSSDSPATWEGSATEVFFNVTNKGHARIQSVAVTYNSGGGQTVETVATPTFSPAAGTYYDAQNVTISCTTVGATIYYTTDESTPTTSSAVYTSAIPVSTTTTIKAIAVKDGMNNSSVAMATYTIQVSGPMVTYEKITSTDDLTDGNYLIVYEEGSLAFDGSLSTLDVAGNTVGVVMNNGIIEIDKAIYFTIDVTQHTIKSASGKYIGRTSDSNGIHENASTVYTNTISFDNDGNAVIIGSGGAYLRYNNASGNLRFRYYNSGNYTGQRSIALFKEKTSALVALPQFTPARGTYNEPQSVAITTATEGAIIYYTTDGTDPTPSSTQYDGTISVGKSMIIKAIAVKDGETSNVATAEYVLKVSTPTFSLAEGTYRGEQSVTISSATPDVIIYYTTDGTDPTTNSTPYTGAISVTETTTIKAIAVFGEMDNSEVATATYTIKEPLSGDVFVKATSESDLEDGLEIIIVNDTYSKVMGEQRENNFGAVSIEIDKTVTPYEAALEDDATTILTLEGQADEWYFKDENGNYLYTASTSSNALHTKNYKDNYTKATISFSGDNSDAVITFQGIASRNIVRYNNGNNALFSCYSSGQEPVQIYYRAPQQTIAKPTITPATETYTEPQTVTITNNAEGTTVYYTVDGTTPTSESTKYTTPFQLGKNGTYVVKAISIGEDGQSRVSTSTITINITVEAPVFTEADGTTFDEPYTIHLTAAEGTIYYTTGGSLPIDEDGNLTSSAIAYNASTGIKDLSNAVTINAVAIDQWGNVSIVSTASYKYIGEVTLPYYENFDEGLGNFTTHPTSTGDKDVKWEFRPNDSEADIAIYGEARKYAYISGGTSASSGAHGYPQYIGKDYLISPVIDLTSVTNATLNFIHAGHHFGTGVDSESNNNLAAKKASCKLFVRDVTNGVPTSVSTGWDDLTEMITNWFAQTVNSQTSGGQYPRINSGDIDLTSYKGKKVQVAFYFETDANRGGMWNVLKFAVTGTQQQETVNYETVNMSTDGYITYVVKNDIDWEKTLAMKNNVHGFKVIQFTERANNENGTTVLVEFGFNEEMSVDPEYALNEEQQKPLWSEKIIPAETPIILKGNKGENLLVIAKNDDVIPAVKGNLLKPSYGDVTASDAQTLYVLQKTSNWIESNPYENYLFYVLGKGSNGQYRTVPNRKAYLNAKDASEEVIYHLIPDPNITNPGMQQHVAPFLILTRVETSPMVSDDAGIVDGINAVDYNNRLNDNMFYSISGVKVNNPSKGIYILNGKKILVK